METTIPVIERPTGWGNTFGDPQTSNLTNTSHTRGFRRSFRRLFRHNGKNEMTRSEFVSLAAGKSSSSSIAGLKLKSVMSLNHIRRRSAADKIIQQSYEEEPAWLEDGMDEAVDQLPLLGAATRSWMT